jgi:iron(III) transport system permease protein
LAQYAPAVLCVAPFLVSGPVLAISLIAIWNRPGPLGMVYDSVLILVFACAARFTFFAERGVSAALSELQPRLTEAAYVFGIPWWRQATGILLPLTWPVTFGVWGLGFVFSMGEIDATALLCPPGRTTLTMRIFSLMHYGPSPMVAALSVMVVALILLSGGSVALLYARSARVVAARTRGAYGHD